MRTPLLVLCSMLALAGCSDAASGVRGMMPADTDDPAGAARAFLQLVKLQRCEEAFTRFTAETQRQIRQRSRQEVRNAPYYAEVFAPENLYCRSTFANRYLSYVPGTTSLAGRRGDTAVVSVMLREGTDFLIPGFFPTSHVDHPVEMLLVREHGEWRVAVPGVWTENPHWDEHEIGGFIVEVSKPEPGKPTRMTRLRGPAGIRAQTFRPIFMDFDRWPELMPFVVEARALEPPRPFRYQHVYVRMRSPEGEEVDFVIDFHHASAGIADSYGHRTREQEAAAASGDSAAPAAPARAPVPDWVVDPPFFRVGWRIPERDTFPATPGVARITTFGATLNVETRQGGTSELEYGFTIRPAEWPASFQRLFTADGAVRAATEMLDRARERARTPAP